MSDALNAPERSRLESLIGKARRILEADLANVAAGRYGIDAEGILADEEDLRLDASALAARREIVAIVAHLRSEGLDLAAAVTGLLREAVFTHLNRLVAIRIAESIELLQPSLAQGRRSQGFRDLLDAAPLLASDETGGYWTYLQLCGDELAGDVPTLFDPRNPLLALAPSPGALDDLVDLLASPTDAQLWTAPDCLGWVYQFFNTTEERQAMRESPAPRNSRELAVRNQFFTPRYVVDFLVQNSLGRRLIDGDPSSPLLDDLPLLVDPPTETGEPVVLRDVSVLDPACGSGHFLLAAYDVLERAWHHLGVSADEAAPSIVQCLWGIDIDPRCTQVAAAAVIFRARRACRAGELPRPNIICARALPPLETGLDDVIDTLTAGQCAIIRRMTELEADAPILGPLLKIEQSLTDEVKAAAIGGPSLPGTLADSLPDDIVQAAEDELISNLTAIAKSTTASPAERLLAAEAQDAVRFVQALQRRYDAVLMNPPFGEPASGTKPYLKATYPWIPATSDLFALFVGRGLELCKLNGYVGAITSRVGMFLTSFTEWRRRIFLAHELPVLADLGEGVMEQAMVEAAAYVLGRRSRSPVRRSVFVRAVAAVDRGSALSSAVTALKSGLADPRIFIPDLDRLGRLAGSPVAYWVDPDTVDILAEHDAFEPSHGVVRVGLQTGDDVRFVRAWWEVSSDRLTRSPTAAHGLDERDQLTRGARWAPIIKSGSSQPWYSPVLLVVDWERDGERLRRFTDGSGKLKSRPQNTELYFQPGFSWTRRAPRLVPYVVPAGCIPSVSRYQAFPVIDPFAAVGLVASNVASAFCRFYGEKFLWPNFLVDNVKNLPIPEVGDNLHADLAARVESGVESRRATYTHLEPYREFTSPREDVGSLSWNAGSLLGPELEERVAQAYGLSANEAEHLELDMTEALSILGMHANEELRIDEEDLGSLPPWGERLLSYLVGVAFGRWDVRIGRDPSVAPELPGPFDPPPATPPGMLLDERRQPARDAPPGYPLSLPPSQVLIDEPGNRWDIETRVLEAANILSDKAEIECADALSALKYRNVRDYLRRGFFKDHLGVYTKGRRKAPIYWPLYVPSRRWGVWIYAPSLSRETLFAVTQKVSDRLDAAEAEIRRLQRERAVGGAGRSVRDVANALEAEEQLAGELRQFREEAERIAALGWQPDLDDGILLCAAPLAGLFPAWRDTTAARREIKAGKYPWASVSRWARAL